MFEGNLNKDMDDKDRTKGDINKPNKDEVENVIVWSIIYMLSQLKLNKPRTMSLTKCYVSKVDLRNVEVECGSNDTTPEKGR